MCHCTKRQYRCQRCEAELWAELEARMKRNVRADIEQAKRLMEAKKLNPINLN